MGYLFVFSRPMRIPRPATGKVRKPLSTKSLIQGRFSMLRSVVGRVIPAWELNQRLSQLTGRLLDDAKFLNDREFQNLMGYLFVFSRPMRIPYTYFLLSYPKS